MKKKQPFGKMKSVKPTRDIDRSFIFIPEVSSDHWREKLDNFFDENEAGQDHMRHLLDISKPHIDHYDFTGGYDLSQVSPKKTSVDHRHKTSLTPITHLREAVPVYESEGSFRYAMP
jgi:hypothetical protein